MTQESDKALEEKARHFIAGVAEHECGAYIGSPCPTCDYRIPRLLRLLREVAEEAKREEAAEWEKIVVLVRDGFRTVREDPQTARWTCDEILRRRGGEANEVPALRNQAIPALESRLRAQVSRLRNHLEKQMSDYAARKKLRKHELPFKVMRDLQSEVDRLKREALVQSRNFDAALERATSEAEKAEADLKLDGPIIEAQAAKIKRLEAELAAERVLFEASQGNLSEAIAQLAAEREQREKLEKENHLTDLNGYREGVGDAFDILKERRDERMMVLVKKRAREALRPAASETRVLLRGGVGPVYERFVAPDPESMDATVEHLKHEREFGKEPTPSEPAHQGTWPCGHAKLHPQDELCRECAP